MGIATVERPRGTAGGGTIDPRIAARRDRVSRDQAHRRRRRIITMALIIIVFAAGWFALQSPIFDVESILVTGNGQTTTDDVLSASGIETGEPLVAVRPGSVRERLLALPWVADAEVDVTWSGEIRLHVRERDPVAIVVTDEGQAVMVDLTGRVLGPAVPEEANLFGDGLVRVEGLQINEPVGKTPARIVGPRSDDALAIASALGPGVRTRVEAVVATGDGVELRLRPTGTVLFGSSSDLDDKVRSLTAVLARVSLDDLETIDVRVPNQPVVKRTSGSADS